MVCPSVIVWCVDVHSSADDHRKEGHTARRKGLIIRLMRQLNDQFLTNAETATT